MRNEYAPRTGKGFVLWPARGSDQAGRPTLSIMTWRPISPKSIVAKIADRLVAERTVTPWIAAKFASSEWLIFGGRLDI